MRNLLLVLSIISLSVCASCTGSTVLQDDGPPYPNITHLENERFATPDNPVVSLSGAYTLVIDSGYNDNVYDNGFAIYESEHQAPPFFRADTRYRKRDRLYFAWDKEDNIWVYSGDIGITLWAKSENVWTVQSPASTDPPDWFREILPQSYQ